MIRGSLLSLLLALSAFSFPRGAAAFKDAGNRPYVQSDLDGVFYARCIPQDSKGSAGFTDIYEVRKEGDKLLDHYEWYTRGPIILGWSPLAGKVAVMAIDKHTMAQPDQQIEFSFYLGGKFLKSWTTSDLQKLGAKTYLDPSGGGERASFKVIGCEQMKPASNEYGFSIEFADGKKVSFDILTGDLRNQ